MSRGQSDDVAQKIDKLSDNVSVLAALIAHDAGYPVGQTQGGAPSPVASIQQWIEADETETAPGTVHTVDGSGDTIAASYDHVKRTDGGWVECWPSDDYESRVEYPPQKVVKIARN
ncbi:hypothetical protein DMJ13_27370 [halophilic archaeon]|nr:hypothetical protein DMJ13_27370 [halophilic archaeon]